MTASSLRNSLHRRNHKERSQLAHRSKFGLLEKHKDYVKRAKDYHEKQDRLTRLKQKASERNKDEFYFSMTRETTRGGIHVKDRGNAVLPIDIVKVLKTQDENYVRTMRSAELKKIDKIKGQLTEMSDLVNPNSSELDLDDAELETLQRVGLLNPKNRAGKRKHVLFAESLDEAKSLSKGKGKGKADDSAISPPSDDESDSDLGWNTSSSKQKGKKKALEPQSPAKFQSPSSEGDSDEEMQDDESAPPLHHAKRLIRELGARLKREQQLRYAIREFEMQRLLMGKGARKKLQGVEKVEGDEDSDDEDALDARGGRPGPRKQVDEAAYKPRVYKWRLERKR